MVGRNDQHDSAEQDVSELHLIHKENSHVLALRGFIPQHQTRTPGTILESDLAPFHKCF